MNILFYILATMLFVFLAVKSWIIYKEKNEKIVLAELVGSVIASLGGLILIITSI